MIAESNVFLKNSDNMLLEKIANVMKDLRKCYQKSHLGERCGRFGFHFHSRFEGELSSEWCLGQSRESGVIEWVFGGRCEENW